MESIAVPAAADQTIAGYIAQYRGNSRYTRLLKLADQDSEVETKENIEALKHCLGLAKSENMLG